MTFGLGQQVVCVDASTKQYAPWRAATGLHGLAEGTVYTVRRDGLYRDQPCIWLEEITRPLFGDETIEAGYHVGRFRVVVARKTDIGVFHEILRKQTVPALV